MKNKLAAFAFILLFSPSLSGAACITDDTGLEVCLEKPPARIVSLYGAYTEILHKTGLGPAIVGRTKNDTTVPGTENLPVVGTGLKPNVEYIMALKPDLVLARGGKAGAEALAMLRQRGIKVAAFDPQSLEELYSTFSRMGRLMGKEAETANEAETIRKAVAEVEAMAKKAAAKPSVVYEISAEPLTVAGADGLINELITKAGGVNPVTTPKKLVRLDVEALLKADPDVYIIQTGPMNVNPQPPENRPHHGGLKAVKEGRTATVDEKVFSRPGPNVAQAVRELFRIIHPELK